MNTLILISDNAVNWLWKHGSVVQLSHIKLLTRFLILFEECGCLLI